MSRTGTDQVLHDEYLKLLLCFAFHCVKLDIMY